MRYSLLDILASPETRAPLVLVGASEADTPYHGPYGTKGERVGPRGAAVGPAPQGETGAFYTRALAQHAAPADDPERSRQVVVTDGILVSTDTGLWYPIIDTIPELRPSRLRDWQRDRAFFEETIAPRIPADLAEALRAASASVDTSTKPGDNYKTSEISLLDKVDDARAFLDPGLYSPFNPHIYDHPAELIRGFTTSLHFLGLHHGARVLDSGSGYSWTTEWLMRLGIDAVGIDITRAYPDVGRRRMGPNNQPHLVVGDAENLPFRDGVFDAVLCFDAFHHIPNRAAAMRQYARTMTPKSRIVLVEPGGQHEKAQVAIDVMNTYGIMEIGMELSDLQGYIAGIDEFTGVREIFLKPFYSDDGRQSLPVSEMRERGYLCWGLFEVEKDVTESRRAAPPAQAQIPAHVPGPSRAPDSEAAKGGLGGFVERLLGRSR